MQLVGAWVPTENQHTSSIPSSTDIDPKMADVAALLLDSHGPISPMDLCPMSGGSPTRETTRAGVVSYTYAATSHECQQAALDRYRGLGKASAPTSALKQVISKDTAEYNPAEAHKHNDNPRQTGEALADDYAGYCLQQPRSSQQTKESILAKKRNVCNSCLRPFDDNTNYSTAATGVANQSRAGETEQRTASQPTKAELYDDDDVVQDGGYVGYHRHVHGDDRSLALPVRTKEEEPQMASPAAGDAESKYEEFLRSNHVVVMPSPAAGNAGDAVSKYEEFLRSNHVVVMPVDTAMGERVQAKAAEAQGDGGGVDAEYVDVCDEEYLDYLRANHVTVDLAVTEVTGARGVVQSGVDTSAARDAEFYYGW